MLPSSNSSLIPHFSFNAISYIPVPDPFTTPVPAAWINRPLSMKLKTENITHYSFAAGLASDPSTSKVFAYVPGSIVSWGFTGTFVGVYATSNGGNGTTEAYFSNWNYEGLGQVRDNRNGTQQQ